jgi:Tetratricopeptide repeat
VNRQTVFFRLAPTVLIALSAFGGACANFPQRISGGGGAAPQQIPATLIAERRLRYAVPCPVAVTAAPEITVPQVHEIELWQSVRSYMAQVGLEVVADPAQPHDVDVALAMNILGVSLLMRGSASLQVTSAGQVIDRVSTPLEIEPAVGFGKSMARELVEALVHSSALAAFADARTGSSPAATAAVPMPGAAGAGAPLVTSVVATDGTPAAATAAPPGATLLTTPAGPPASGPDRVATAKAHARQASAYYDVGRYADAFAEFEQAYLIEQDPALLYNMGQCQRKLGNVAEATQFYRTYLRRAPHGPSAPDAEKRIRELESQPPAKTKK